MYLRSCFSSRFYPNYGGDSFEKVSSCFGRFDVSTLFSQQLLSSSGMQWVGGESISCSRRQMRSWSCTPTLKSKFSTRGSYRDTLNKMIAAVQAGTAPHVVQVFEIGTQMMIDGGVAIPIEEMMEADLNFRYRKVHASGSQLLPGKRQTLFDAVQFIKRNRFLQQVSL